MGVGTFLMYKGRMTLVEDIIADRSGKKKIVIETPSEKPKVIKPEEVIKEVVDTPKVNELDDLRAKYLKIFGRKAHHMLGIDKLKEKIAEASEA